MSEAPIVLQSLAVSFVAGHARIVDEASLELRAGEVIGLIGPNGAGKSTLLKLASRELIPAAGSILLNGLDVQTLPPAMLAGRRAVVAQSAELSFPFTASEVVRLGATVPGFEITTPTIDAACSRALHALDLDYLKDRRYTALSGGERQRVQIARALCQLETANRDSGEPQLLLLDEPTSSLDIAHQRMVLEVIKDQARRGTAVLAVLHDVNLASVACDRLVLMRGGRVLASGTPKDVVVSSILSEAYGCRITANALPAGDTPFTFPFF